MVKHLVLEEAGFNGDEEKITEREMRSKAKERGRKNKKARR